MCTRYPVVWQNLNMAPSIMSCCGRTRENMLVEGGSRIFLPVLQNSRSVMRSVKNPMYSSALQREKGYLSFTVMTLKRRKKYLRGASYLQ